MTKTVIVTAGCGEYAKWAARLCARLRRINDDVPCLDLSGVLRWDGLTHPTWVKAQVWAHVPDDVERVVWLDADVFPVRRMPLEDVPRGAAFAAVPEAREVLMYEREKLPALRTCTAYCNAGMFVACREGLPLMEEIGRKMLAAEQGHYLDQSWLNVLLDGRFYPLPPAWNWMIDADDAPTGLINLHAAGLGNEPRWKVLRALHAAGEVAECVR